MPELRDDTTEDGFHEIQFTRKQLVFLFMTASVLLSLVFILGVLTGRGMANRGVETPIDAEMAELNPAPVPGDQPSAATAEPQPATTEGLTYPENLSGKPEGEKTRPVESAPAPPPAAPTAEPPAVAPTEEPPARPRVEEEKPTPQVPATSDLKVPTSGQPGAWVIQVMALKTRQPAAERVQSLRRKGYDAFLENPAPGVFRVRIGRFKQRVDAERVARRLQKEERLSSVISR